MRRWITCAIGSLLLPFAIWTEAPSQAPTRFEFRQRHMGVIGRIVLYAPTEAEAARAATAAFARIAELEQVMSDYRPSSELMRLAASPPGVPRPVGADLFRVLAAAQRLSELSGGAFDITAGPVVRLWREARRSGSMPDPTALRAARARVDWRALALDSATRTVTLHARGLELDLGGIAKGDAADQALAVLRRQGTPRALVELGGDLVAGEPPPGEPGWRVALLGTSGEPPLLLANAAISTSGDTEQFVEIGGIRYSHIVDPRTGIGVTHRAAATVVAPTGLLADGLGTAVSVLGAERGWELVGNHFPAAAVHLRLAP